MTAKPEPAPPSAVSPADQRRRLLRGIAFAASAIVLLLGAAVLQDRQRAEPPVAPAPEAESPAPAPLKVAAEGAVPVKPAESAAPAATPAATPAAPPEAPASTPASTAAAEGGSPAAPSQTPAVAASTTQEKPPTTLAPAGDKPAANTPNQTEATPAPPPAVAADKPAEPPSKPDAPAPAPVQPAGEALPPAARTMGAPTGSGYHIQVGVFGNPANAEKLRVKLESHGYPRPIRRPRPRRTFPRQTLGGGGGGTDSGDGHRARLWLCRRGGEFGGRLALRLRNPLFARSFLVGSKIAGRGNWR